MLNKKLFARLDPLLGKEDLDRRGLEICLDAIANKTCSDSEAIDVAVFEAFSDYFMERLRDRQIDKQVLDFYLNLSKCLQSDHIIENDIDYFLDKDDPARSGIENCLEGIAKRKCSNCSPDLIFFDAFFDYFRENLESRNVYKKVIDFYLHTLRGLQVIHCFYNPDIAKYRSECIVATSLP